MPIKQLVDVFYQIWDETSSGNIQRKLCKTANFTNTQSIEKLQDYDYKPGEAMSYVVKEENIPQETPLALWVMMNLRMIMEMMEVNESEPMEVD